MYRILRYFSIASLASIVLASILLTLLYRHVAIKGIEHAGEKINTELAKTVLSSIKTPLADYLASVASIDKPGAVIKPINARLERAIQGMMSESNVVRIKIYNRHGIVVFSTKTSQIGSGQVEDSNHGRHENPGFMSAIKGTVASKLVYRDSFNPFDQTTEEDNLIQTYVPVRRAVRAPILGVFEIYTDVNPPVAYAEYTEITTAVGASIILILLYLALLFIVRRAEKIIVSQQGIIRERTETLELLSAQLLTAQEVEKKRLASELNEGVAQTLSAIKYQVEHACQIAGQQSVDETAKSLAAIVTAIQNEIQKISAMAMDLRPPSLDDLGVVATIKWYFRQFQSRYPEIHVQSEISIRENEVSRALKIIIYRIIQEALENIAKFALANRINVQLNNKNGNIALTIEDNGRMYKLGEKSVDMGKEKRIWFYAIEERAVLSGGAVSIVNGASGGSKIQIMWPG